MENCNREIFSRVELLTGPEAMERIARSRAILFGIGGVGSWTAEALVRSGIGHLTMVDADDVAVSNINRQLMATHSTVGKAKTEALRERLLDINPETSVTCITKIYSGETADEFELDSYDYVIDAIDSLAHKATLILNACRSRARLFSSMGAARKMDPTRIDVAEFWKVKGCPLAAALRRRFKHNGTMPRKKFRCVYSDELVPNSGEADSTAGTSGTMTYGKVAVNGALCHITIDSTTTTVVVESMVIFTESTPEFSEGTTPEPSS